MAKIVKTITKIRYTLVVISEKHLIIELIKHVGKRHI